MTDPKKLQKIMLAVQREATRAMSLHAPMHNEHEGYAVILEELDELWDEIKLKQSARNPPAIRQEALQVAAMAIRMIYDLEDGWNDTDDNA
jgi:hypothetical protein